MRVRIKGRSIEHMIDAFDEIPLIGDEDWWDMVDIAEADWNSADVGNKLLLNSMADVLEDWDSDMAEKVRNGISDKFTWVGE